MIYLYTDARRGSARPLQREDTGVSAGQAIRASSLKPKVGKNAIKVIGSDPESFHAIQDLDFHFCTGLFLDSVSYNFAFSP